jgi:hypothetical protein
MKWRCLLLVLLLAACQPLTPQQPTLPEATRDNPEWLPTKYFISDRSATAPIFSDPEVTFNVHHGECSTKTDRRGRSDCATKTTRSAITAGDTFRIGHQYLFGFDFWIDPELTHAGYSSASATRTNGFSSRLSIARWEGDQYPDNQLFDLKVDTTRGVTFMGRACVKPSGFGQWHRFDMRMRWADDDTGFIEVRCNARPVYSGRPIYAASNIPTNQALDCTRDNHCQPGVAKNPQRFRMELGIIFDPELVNGQVVFPRIPAEGLTVKMRRPIARRLYVIFNRYDTL